MMAHRQAPVEEVFEGRQLARGCRVGATKPGRCASSRPIREVARPAAAATRESIRLVRPVRPGFDRSRPLRGRVRKAAM
ncbi:hypothetical protein ACPA9J_27505 [Pseudomonas aeruginosa]